MMGNRIVIPTRPLVLPKTGQTTSYDTGDDGHYEAGSPMTTRFQATGDGTVLDRATGLEWPAEPAASPGAPFNGTMTWAAALAACEALSYAGRSDWRLPNRYELASLINGESAAPMIYSGFFTLYSTYYWTSSTEGLVDTAATYAVGFNIGAVYPFAKSGSRYAIPVRGGIVNG